MFKSGDWVMTDGPDVMNNPHAGKIIAIDKLIGATGLEETLVMVEYRDGQRVRWHEQSLRAYSASGA